jgi:hypothetical protein
MKKTMFTLLLLAMPMMGDTAKKDFYGCLDRDHFMASYYYMSNDLADEFARMVEESKCSYFPKGIKYELVLKQSFVTVIRVNGIGYYVPTIILD